MHNRCVILGGGGQSPIFCVITKWMPLKSNKNRTAITDIFFVFEISKATLMYGWIFFFCCGLDDFLQVHYSQRCLRAGSKTVVFTSNCKPKTVAIKQILFLKFSCKDDKRFAFFFCPSLLENK